MPAQPTPKSSMPIRRPVLFAAGCCAAGAGLMYMLDPDRGHRRRTLTRDKVLSAGRQTAHAVAQTTGYMRGRLMGLAARTASFIRPEPPASDEKLVNRIRSAIGRVVSNPGAIEITAHDGIVTVRGPVLADEAHALLRKASQIHGVCAVENQLEPHEHAGEVSGLQGARRTIPPRWRFMRENWPPSTRLMAGSLGTILTVWGVRRKGFIPTASMLAGGALVVRAFTNLPARRLTGIRAGRHAVDVRKTIHIQQPIDRIFNFFANYQNFPLFMSNVRDVHSHDIGRSHWSVAGPAGTTLEWEAELTQLIPNQLIAWTTLPGALIPNTGSIRFEPTVDGGTRVDIRLSYNPPAGTLGHAMAMLFGADPRSQMDEDLARVKTALETGTPARDAARPLI